MLVFLLYMNDIAPDRLLVVPCNQGSLCQLLTKKITRVTDDQMMLLVSPLNIAILLCLMIFKNMITCILFKSLPAEFPVLFY